MAFKLGQRRLTAAQQYACISTNSLCVGAGKLRRGRLVWRYKAAPTPMSRVYSVRLRYHIEHPPEVVVEEPDLCCLASGRRLPHVYAQKPTRLCLYLPGVGEWEPWMRIDRTIVPWCSVWLFYFEEWLVSDEWKGGGAHPSKRRLDGAIPLRPGGS